MEGIFSCRRSEIWDTVIACKSNDVQYEYDGALAIEMEASDALGKLRVSVEEGLHDA